MYVHECVYEWYVWGRGYCHSQLGSALVGLGVARVQLHSQGAVFNRLSQLAKLEEVDGDIILTYLCNQNPIVSRHTLHAYRQWSLLVQFPDIY